MKEINLREYYPFYNMDVYLEVTDEIAGQLDRFKLDEEAHRVRILRAKAYFSLDRGDGIEDELHPLLASLRRESENLDPHENPFGAAHGGGALYRRNSPVWLSRGG